MNERIRELLEQATEVYDYWYKGESVSMVDYKMFAELLYKDIITVVAAQALLNESAMDVFINLKKIYEVDTK